MSATNATSLTPVWIGPHVIENRRIGVPDPGPGAAVLRVEAAGLCGTDAHLAATQPPYPMVLGHEISGEIVAFGTGTPETDADSQPLAVGDRVALLLWVSCGHCWACTRFGPGAASCLNGFVYGVPFERTGVAGTARLPSAIDAFPGLTGGYGQYLYVHPGTLMWRIDSSLPPETAVLLDPLAVAVRTVDIARTAADAWDNTVSPETTAVVQGAGTIGLLTTMVLRRAGIGRITVIGSRPARLALAGKMGADLVLDLHETTGPEREAALRDLTHGRGADLVLDCTNQPAALTEALHLARRMGTVVETGNVVNGGETIRLDPAKDLCQQNLRLLGMSFIPARAFATAARLLHTHTEPPLSDLVTHRYPRTRALDAIAAMHTEPAVKVILTEQASR